MKYCLIATLGTEAQVITAVLDCLLFSKVEISYVSIIHTSTHADPIQIALEKIQLEAEIYPSYKNIKFSFVPILSLDGEKIKDIDSIEAGQAGFSTLYRVIFEAKQKELMVILCISGGRKNLSLFGMSAAQLLFDDDDKLVHLYSSNSYLSSKTMHPNPSQDANLIEIPVLLWSSISPAYLLLSDTIDPIKAMKKYKEIHLEERVEIGRVFHNSKLTPAEQQVVELLVSRGLSDNSIGQILHISDRTVESHIRSARYKAERFFHLPSLNRSGLIALLQPAITFLLGGKFRENTDDT